MEHVNFFSPQSLVNLLARYGYECVFVDRVGNGFWGHGRLNRRSQGCFYTRKSKNECVRDTETELALLRYIEASRSLEERISKIISGLVKARFHWQSGERARIHCA